MDRKTAARTLREIGRLLEVTDDNPYRARAFAGAARTVETLSGDIAELIRSGEIRNLRGIGRGSSAVLEQLASGNRPQALLEAEAKVPPGVRDMLTLPGLGPKKVRTLWNELGVETLGELEYACRENRLLELKGFGPASQASVLDALSFRAQTRDRRLVHEAWTAAAALIERLRDRPGVGQVLPAGELRRGCETVGELALVVELADPAQAETVARSFGSAETVGAGEWALHADGSLPVRLCFAGRRELGAVWLQATGDDEFLAGLEARAAGSGSVFSVVGSDEAEVLTALGLPWIPPELRRGRRWIEAAACGVLPRLVELGDLRGALHNHTTDSDGLATLEEMAGAAAGLGWSFFGVADHSPAAFYANGLDAERLRAQWSRADAWNDDHHDLRIVKGLEADILADGRLDIPEGCEAGLEVVVASVHSSFKMPAEVQTERLVTAVRNPACRILGHPTGRLLLARPAYEVDLERVLDACAEAGVAVEINASPYRLDLDATWARCALDRGLRLVVNPDAHSVDGLDDVRWGVTVARRAGATAIDVINCGDLETFL